MTALTEGSLVPQADKKNMLLEENDVLSPIIYRIYFSSNRT